MNLYRTELHRFMRRRLTLLFGLCSLVGLLLLAFMVAATSRNAPTPDELAFAEEQAAMYQADLDRCRAEEDYFEQEWGYNANADYPELGHAEVCEELLAWGTDPVDHYPYGVFRFAEDGVLILIGVTIVAGLLVMLLAASLIGAEWSSGGMSNLLVWHPNRWKVWGAKLGAALTMCAAAVGALLALAFPLFYAAAALRGEVGELDAQWWEGALAVLARTAALTLGMTVAGSALAMLGRHTAVAGGVIAGYLVIGDLLVRLAGVAFKVQYPDLFSLYTWVTVWIIGDTQLYSYTDLPEEMSDPMTLTIPAAGLLIGGVVLVLTALATWSFTRRDVT